MYKAKDVSNVFVFGFRTQVGACKVTLCGVRFAPQPSLIHAAFGRCMQLHM